MKTTDNDVGHTMTVFKQNGLWGALSKANHSVLRYRDPVYKSVRELVVSYFNEYFLDNGKKTLRYYLSPFSLNRYGKKWLISDSGLFNIEDDLNESKPVRLIDKNTKLRPADQIEIEAGKLTEWKEK